MRPIVSQSSSLLSPSAQFIDHVLQPLANIYPDYIPNSTALILHLQDLVVPDDAILVTVDVTNLYPSIPQSECLNIIHTEMHKHSHLFTFDPNFITRLLHININYNYFNFGNHTFQQVRGTAMGAAFSPTIANIFLSTIIRSFLLTQPIHPLAIARYIDDIVIIWTHTTETLTIFLNNLNSFHPNLCFTHEHSTTSADFLDLTIYKGPDFPITNILDLKTFQKPRNLYQYLHYKSSHQNQVFKSIIRGECIRYTRTNTTEATYRAMIYMFKQRLLKRGYPETLVNRVIHTVNYSDRQKYIQKHQKHQPTCSPPLLKCIPPPQYQLLKKIIYAQLKYISPRFIALRPHMLQSILVRAKLTPTDERSSNNATHGKCETPKTQLQSTPRHGLQTLTLRNLLISSPPDTHISLNTPTKPYYLQNQTHIIMQISQCCIFNNLQKMQQTVCWMHNTTTYPGHILNQHLKVQAIDAVTQEDNIIRELYRLECYWIKTLHTLIPHGLNNTPGNTRII